MEITMNDFSTLPDSETEHVMSTTWIKSDGITLTYIELDEPDICIVTN